MGDAPVATPLARVATTVKPAPERTAMFFWQDACTDENMGWTRTFSLLLVIFSVITAIGCIVRVAHHKISIKYAISACIQAIVMFFMWRHCRKWWEILLWHIIIVAVVGPAVPMTPPSTGPPK